MTAWRPELQGTFGMATSSHWLASAAGVAVLERGGNAFDAGVAAGLVLQVVQPHLNGPAGELTALLWSQRLAKPLVLCGQGPAPALATIDRFHELGHDAVPGVGPLSACVPGAFDAWMLLLRDFGTWRLADVAEFAIGYAERGFPAARRISDIIGAARTLLERWKASAELYLPAPAAGSLMRNRSLAATYRRIVADSRGGSRESEIDRARAIWSHGFVADAMHLFAERSGGLLRGGDLGDWRAGIEPPLTFGFRGLTVCKAGPWSQGPVFLQQLAMLDQFDLDALHPNSVEYVHTVVECAKLAFADRDALYGDPDFVEVPLVRLLSRAYNRDRARLVAEQASVELRPGSGEAPTVAAEAGSTATAPGQGEPTRGDTVHLDVVDRHGNLLSVTPSGGWLQSSPAIPALGFPLGTRAQMFLLDKDHPNGLAPGKRPRTTLSPSLVMRDGKPWLAFGTPGGDQQDQWTLGLFLNCAIQGLGLQTACDEPAFHTNHLVGSFHPHAVAINKMEAEPRLGDDVIDGLRRRGHNVKLAPDWSLGRVMAVARDRDGVLRAAARSGWEESYAVGR